MMKKDSDYAKGYTCECGTEHTYPAYVHSHWRELLIHTCEKCGRKHEILAGVATLIPEEDET